MAKSDDAVSACLFYRGPMHGWTVNELFNETKWGKLHTFNHYLKRHVCDGSDFLLLKYGKYLCLTEF